jgi:hypothetical protein
MKFIKTHSNKKLEYLLATYSSEEKCYVLLDQYGKISLIDNMGESKSFKFIDKDDKVILL